MLESGVAQYATSMPDGLHDGAAPRAGKPGPALCGRPASAVLPSVRRGTPARPCPPPGAAEGGRTAWFAGTAAEAAAERLYAEQGGCVIARRWRCAEGEIDLAIALGSTIVFVEVKARRSIRAAAEALRPAQARRLIRAVSRFLADLPPDQDARIDVVLVDRFGGAERIENAVGQNV
jgi:putative endonuclease